jgi:hypothetical protein
LRIKCRAIGSGSGNACAVCFQRQAVLRTIVIQSRQHLADSHTFLKAQPVVAKCYKDAMLHRVDGKGHIVGDFGQTAYQKALQHQLFSFQRSRLQGRYLLDRGSLLFKSPEARLPRWWLNFGKLIKAVRLLKARWPCAAKKSNERQVL